MSLSPTTDPPTRDHDRPVVWALYRMVQTLDPIQAFDYLERYDALLLPASCTAALDAGEDYVDRSIAADGGVRLHNHLENFLTLVFNIVSRCPVLAVPSGFGARHAPTGVQIAGRTYDDLTVFRVGAALEAARPWDRRPPLEVAG